MGEISDTEFDIICSTSEIGKSLVRKVVVETIDSTWGSPTTSTYSTSSMIGIIIPMNDKDIIELQGRVKSGDMKGFFKKDSTLNNDDIIIELNGTDEYRVENIRIMNAGTNDVFQKCILVRIT